MIIFVWLSDGTWSVGWKTLGHKHSKYFMRLWMFTSHEMISPAF